jgi:hypothetical protein
MMRMSNLSMPKTDVLCVFTHAQPDRFIRSAANVVRVSLFNCRIRIKTESFARTHYSVSNCIYRIQVLLFSIKLNGARTHNRYIFDGHLLTCGHYYVFIFRPSTVRGKC